METRAAYRLSRAALGALIGALVDEGRSVVGPRLREGALAYDVLSRADDLAAGWSDEQEPAFYRLRQRDDGALFQNVVASNTWKRFLFPPHQTLWCAIRRDPGFRVHLEPTEKPGTIQPPLAFVGVRPCDLAALAIQDGLFTAGAHGEPIYQRRRQGLFLVVVQCSRSASTCFCASMGTGPRAESGFDVALTEFLLDGAPRLIAEAGSQRGGALLAGIQAPPASEHDLEAARAATRRAAVQQARRLESAGLRERLQGNLEDPRWDEVAQRCLACGNCTCVCPTCFCSRVDDRISLDGKRAVRWRRWDSCFHHEHSHLHGGSVRVSTRSRYRQWLTHKLGTWIDQFGTSGCVGCGRCMTWCPAGIDLTEEARAIGESEHGEKHSRSSR